MHRRLIWLGCSLVVVATLLAVVSLSGWSPVCACAARLADPPRSANNTSSALRVQVISVAATLDRYNPMISHHGIPAERVNFTLRGAREGSAVVCKIGVFHLGSRVGSTYLDGGSATSESTSVEVTGGNFAGKPSDAHVACRVPAVVTVPLVVGQNLSSGMNPPQSRLSSLWLYVAIVKQASIIAPVGMVIGQTPAPGSEESTGNIVTLTVSSGSPNHP